MLNWQNKIKLNYENIILEKTILSSTVSRSHNDVSAKLGKLNFALPIAVANMPSIQTYNLLKYFDDCGIFYSKHRINGAEEVLEFCRFAEYVKFRNLSISVGVKEEWCVLLETLKSQNIYPDYITLDVADSYNINILDVAELTTELFPDAFFIVGNGMTKEWVGWLEGLCNVGVDAVKVGIGVSAVCETYNATGYKSSTISHLYECSEAAKRVKIIADGGLTIKPETGNVNICDVAKAIRFGADFVWSGSIWARCMDNPAFSHSYFGNSTERAKNYSDHIEGCEMDVHNVKYVRNTADTIEYIRQSLQSSISYCGGNKLMDLRDANYWVKL